MNTIIAMHNLRDYAPGLRNRDQNQQAKTSYVGDVLRTRFSTQAIKYAVRRLMFPETIISSHLNDLIAFYIGDCIETGKCAESDRDKLQTAFEEAICVIKSKKSKNTKSKQSDDADNEPGNNDTKKGRQCVSYQRQTLLAILEALTNEVLANGIPTDGRLLQIAQKVYAAAPVDPSIALFGVMSTHDVMNSLYAAAAVADAIAINRYAGDSDFWTSTGYLSATDKNIPKFLRMWQEHEAKNPGSENMGIQDLPADSMYEYAHVDVRTFAENVTCHDEAAGIVTDVTSIAQRTFTDFFTYLMTTAPVAQQATHASFPACEIAYFEVIENGQPVTMSWSDPISYDKVNKKSVITQGIEKMAVFAADETYRTGKITRYVMLGAQHADKRDLFEAAGVKVLRNMNELSEMLNAVTANAIANL